MPILSISILLSELLFELLSELLSLPVGTFEIFERQWDALRPKPWMMPWSSEVLLSGVSLQ